MEAYTYPILNLFWTMFLIFAFVLWIYLLIIVLADVFRSHDMHGWAKALWVVGVLLFPLLGILAYLIFRGGGMAERSAAEAERHQVAFDQYIRETAHTNGSSADQLSKLADLRDSGKVTEDEYQRAKEKILQ